MHLCALLSALFLTEAQTALVETTKTLDKLILPFPPTSDLSASGFSAPISFSTPFTPMAPVTPANADNLNNPSFSFPVSTVPALKQPSLGQPSSEGGFPTYPSNIFENDLQPETSGSEYLDSKADLGPECLIHALNPATAQPKPTAMACNSFCTICYGEGDCDRAIIYPAGGTQQIPLLKLCAVGTGPCYSWSPERTKGNGEAISDIRYLWDIIGYWN